MMAEHVAIETVQMETSGPIPEGAVDLARERVAALLRLAREPVLFARVKLTVRTEPTMPRLAIAQANLDINGRPIRAQATAETMWRAVNELRDRLLIRLARVSRDWTTRHGNRPLTSPRDWRSAGVPARRPPDLSRPAEKQYVVRHKTVKLVLETPVEAALDMELLDYDFYLFTDPATGQDSAICRNGVRYCMARLACDADVLAGGAGPVVVDRRPAPVLTAAQAVERLETRNLGFVFFADSETRRGRVIYRRYDGHYGVLTASAL
jgi:ribosome-associated translation inhibitor RaiA